MTVVPPWGLWLGSRAKIKSKVHNVPTKIATTRVWYGVVWYGVCVCVCASACVCMGRVEGLRCSKSQESGLQASNLHTGNIPGKQGPGTFWSLTFAHRLHQW